MSAFRKSAPPRTASNIAAMLGWMRNHSGPIYTSRAHPDYPGLVEFPLADVIDSCGQAYFNNTAAYAIALAVHIGVKRISMFGCDYTYPNAHDAERGRACAEFHLGIAHARGIKLAMPAVSSLMDSLYREQDRLYGYDSEDLTLSSVDGRVQIARAERAQLPSADEIEARYDHSKHPNPIVKG